MPTRFIAGCTLALALTAGCASARRAPSDVGAIIFENRSLDPADVFAVATPGADMRLGTVTAGRTDTLTVPGTVAGRSVVIVARVLARSVEPRSGPITLLAGDRVRVVLPVDQSTLTVLPATTP